MDKPYYDWPKRSLALGMGIAEDPPTMISDTGNFQIYNATGQVGGTRQNSVARAIQQASARTGVDFNYLVKQANVESSMNPNAKARTSSATGLYQFIDQTWLREMKAHGAEHGYAAYANAIKQNANGDYTVANRGTKNAILNLRKDPQASSIMAGELAQENNAYLKDAVGGTPSSTDLYLAHFLGAQGAANFITSMQKNPWAAAASFFPEAAHSNKAVFYSQGRPLSLQQVYNNFNAKFDGTANAPVQTAMASGDIDHMDEGPSAPEVILPSAIIWNNLDETASAAQNFATTAANNDIRALTSDTSDEQTTGRSGGFGQRLSWPSRVVFMAQNQSMQYAHDDQSRYNS